MTRMALIGMVLAGTLLAPSAAFAQISCSRDGLQRTVDLYIAAQTKGDTSGLPLATGLGYMENAAPADVNNGVIKTAMTIDHHRSLLDPSTCQTFTEVIVTNKEKPYVLGTRMRVNRDKIAELEILWTTTGYWLFNADAYLKWSSSEKWDAIPVNQRDTRATLVAAANAYLDAFLEGKAVKVRARPGRGGATLRRGAPTRRPKLRRGRAPASPLEEEAASPWRVRVSAAHLAIGGGPKLPCRRPPPHVSAVPRTRARARSRRPPARRRRRRARP